MYNEEDNYFMMRRSCLYSLPIVVLLACISGLGAVLLQPDRLLNFTLAPDIAVQDMLQVSRNNLQQFEMMVNRRWGLRQRLLVFRYRVQPAGGAAHDEFGYALVEWRAGWSASPGRLHANAAAPALLSYATDMLDGQPVVYGRAIDQRVGRVQVLFSDGSLVAASVEREGLLIVGPAGTGVQEVRALNLQGQVLERYQQARLAERAQW